MFPAIAPRRYGGILLGALLCAGAGGCLSYESVETAVTFDPASHRYTYVETFHNIQSTGASPQEWSTDFRDLLDLRNGDQFLLEELEGGRYVKRRELWLTGAALNGRCEGVFAATRGLEHFFNEGSGDSTGYATGFRDDRVLSTNGAVSVQGESTTVTWPPHTTKFLLHVQASDFRPGGGLADSFARHEKPTARGGTHR